MRWLRSTRLGRWAFWRKEFTHDGTLVVVAPGRLNRSPRAKVMNKAARVIRKMTAP